MHSKGFWATIALGVLTATLLAVGLSGPAAAAPGVTAGRIGPGTQLVTAGRSCTANFVFRDAQHRVFVGYAASCATRTPAGAAGTCARSLPQGTVVRLADRGRTLGYGALRYSSFRSLRRAGVTDAASCAADDFALVEIRGAARRRVSPAVPYWGGPTGVADLPAAGATVFGLARPSAAARTIPRAGQVSTVSTSIAAVTTLLPGTRAERGSGFLDESGRAVGILTSSAASGENSVVGLAGAIAFARHHGVPGLRVVSGGAFSGAAVL